MLLKIIRGIKAQDVIVFGPSKSGKTYLLLALFEYFVNSLNGTYNEVIISPKEEELRIESMLKTVNNGEHIRSTYKNELAMYTLRGRKLDIIPIEFTMIDYSGELVHVLSLQKYRKVLADLSKAVNENEATIEGRIGSMEFLEWLKENHSTKFDQISEDVVLAYLYKRLANAGKIIFLIDGDYIYNFHKGNSSELTDLFGQYGRIMGMFGDNKKYVLVATKTDRIKNLTNVPENSADASDIEKEIYQMLQSILTFKALVARSKNPMYFYTVSADATGNLNKLYSWGIEKIVEFGF